MRGAVQIAQLANDLVEQSGRIAQFHRQFVRGVAHARKGIGGRTLARDHELVGAKVEFLERVDHRVHGHALAIGDEAQLLELLDGHTGAFCLATNFGNGGCGLLRRASRAGGDEATNGNRARYRALGVHTGKLRRHALAGLGERPADAAR